MKENSSRIRGIGEVLKNAGKGFVDDKITKLSGSLAYYMVFSMGPLLVIIISMCSIFFGQEAVEGKVYQQLEGFVGHDTALSLQDIIKHAAISGKNTIATIVSVVVLVIGATSVFGEMQDSINTIWGIKPKPKQGWVAYLKNRFLSFSVIVSLGFLLLVSLGISALLEGFKSRLQSIYPEISVILLYVLNLVLTIGVTGLIFAAIFKVLPDAQIKWKDVMIGAAATTFLFLLGKFGISLYIARSNVGTTYGTAGSLVILLLWIYYSAMILYFGAEFTKAYAIKFGDDISPAEYAVTVKQVEEEKGNMSLQDKEQEEKGKK